MLLLSCYALMIKLYISTAFNGGVAISQYMPIADFCSHSKLARMLGFEDSKK